MDFVNRYGTVMHERVVEAQQTHNDRSPRDPTDKDIPTTISDDLYDHCILPMRRNKRVFFQ